MRLHVVGLPHTQATRDFCQCAYTNKIRGFCNMMTDRGHHVYLYAGDKTDARVSELIPCISEDERVALVGDKPYVEAQWGGDAWRKFNLRASAAITAREQPGDIICVIGGIAHKSIAELVPELQCVEFGIGYGGTFSQYRVFESYAWMHVHYGAVTNNNALASNGSWDDVVIPGYFDPDDFDLPVRTEIPDESYLFYMARVTHRKGVTVATDIAERLNKKLILAGANIDNLTFPSNVEYVGPVGIDARKNYLRNATALIQPTLYVEPFGNNVVEAQALGTPVITTDWGAFAETVEDGKTGFRCHSLLDFKTAIDQVDSLDRNYIKDRTYKLYSLEATALKYEKYLQRVSNMTLPTGWYTL